MDLPEGADDAQELPAWVIDGSGTIRERFDNVATEEGAAASRGPHSTDDVSSAGLAPSVLPA